MLTPNLEAETGSRLDGRFEKVSAALALLGIATELLVFRANFLLNVSPYCPVGWDQLFTYSSAYQAFFTVRNMGLRHLYSPSLRMNAYLFKGFSVPLLTLLAGF